MNEEQDPFVENKLYDEVETLDIPVTDKEVLKDLISEFKGNVAEN